MMHRTYSLTTRPRRATIGLGVAAMAMTGAMLLTSGLSRADATDGAPVSDAAHSKLRDAIGQARDLDGQARVDALKKVRDDAADGAYGPRVAHRVERRAAFFADMPDALRADLEKAWASDADDRWQQVKDIRKKALDGGYGKEAQEFAQRMKDRRKDGRGHHRGHGPFGGGFGPGGFGAGGFGPGGRG
jgi:hypothetical protein